jgi:hypothetical protein
MDLSTIYERLAANPAISLTVTAFVVALTDFITGTSRAVREGSFRAEALPTWLTSHVVGRVFPIAGTAILGYAFYEPLYVIAGLGLVTYLAESVKSIRANLLVPGD